MINVDTLTAEVNLPIYKLRYYVPNILNMVNDYRKNNPTSVNNNSHLSSWRSDWQTHKKDSRFNILIDFTIQALESFHLELFHSKKSLVVQKCGLLSMIKEIMQRGIIIIL